MARRLPRSPARAAHVGAAELDVTVRNRQRARAVNTRWLERVARDTLVAQRVAAAELCVLVVDDAQIAAFHEEWFADPSPTDVITFDLSADPGPHAPLQGDIVVSVETAALIARDLRRGGLSGWTQRHELAYYVVHGILHLTGCDDRSAADRRAMRARERAVMQAIGLPAPPRRAGR